MNTPELTEDMKRFYAETDRKQSQTAATHEGVETDDLIRILRENLPEVAPPLPYDMTDEGKRMAGFKRMCPDQFRVKIDRSKLPNPDAFDRAAAWNGSFRGPALLGATGSGKTLAAWSALGRLHVKDGLQFAWFPVRRLVTEIEKWEDAGNPNGFWWEYRKFDVLMVDDLDKINWSFDSQTAALFQFYDWIYRDHRPCITTTNKDRDWWDGKMGSAFTRRVFDDAQFTVQF